MTAPKSAKRRQLIGGAVGMALTPVLPAFGKAIPTYDVVVVGAGLSGLHAATLLEENGLTVQTLEGRNRIGGRVYTLMDIPGKPEAAGELIGGNYARMIQAAKKMNLELIDPDRLGAGSKWYFRINGQNIRSEDWSGHELNPMTGKDRELLPSRYLFELSHRDNPLSGQPLDAWIRPEFAKYDIPQSQYLKQYLGYSDETIRLMNTVVHTDHLDNTSALHELRRYAVGEFNRRVSSAGTGSPLTLQIKGGNSRLPYAMAQSLENGVLTGKTVYAFEDRGSEVITHCGDGTRYRSRKVVCSMPYPVMKSVKFLPRLSARMEAAIDEIDYGISIQVHYLLKRNFWEDDGLPPNIWSDGAFERFAVLTRGENGAPSSAIAFINGNEAYKYNFMTDQQAMDYTTAKLIEARPSIKGALEPVLVQSCHRDVHGAGDWVFWRPGQVTQYAAHMRDAHGNIEFCGEHTALLERGMEGAFESGERAAISVLSAA
ncbi:MAG: NAD(P)/FAD-dependent oxidoreductase [Pseudomonadota bacterium]